MNFHSKLLLSLGFFFLSSDPKYAVGLEVGILGYELFLKETNTRDTFHPPGWDLQMSGNGQDFQKIAYLNRVSGESMFVGLSDKNKKNNFVWDLDIKLTTGKETGLKPFYLGKNNYIGYETSKFLIGVGRREHLFRPKSFQTSFDGGEGLFIEFLPEKNLTLQFFLWDRYSGSLLFEKDKFRKVLQNPTEPNVSLSEETLVNESSRNHHRRHAFGLLYGDYFKLRMGIQYIEFGTWGRYVKDSPRETKISGADGDSLLNGNFGLGYDADIFEVQMDLLWAKGNDRTNSKIASRPGSIPISGEAVQLGAELRLGDFLVRSSHFLSDRDETNNKNQIIREGYVSFGSHPAQTPYISQIFGIFPSAAVTESGFERNFALQEGRCFGYLNELVIKFTYHQFVAKVVGAYFLPYKVDHPSDGRISFQKRDFENFFIGEGVMELSLNEDSTFEIGIGVSKLFLPESLAIKSNFGYVFGRIQI